MVTAASASQHCTQRGGLFAFDRRLRMMAQFTKRLVAYREHNAIQANY
ncbi:hypothetical protein KCP75_03870 [Salmonella enterica subsp. enterica]|nr:hypothetical protein KCP75_03870 [Salmonella enterica subsp. enterica]